MHHTRQAQVNLKHFYIDPVYCRNRYTNWRCHLASSQRTTKDELIEQDIKRLHGLGYAQELFRSMGGFSNFAISFTIISILSGCVTLFYLVPTTSGFAAASIGWPLVTIFVVIVALGMAELASAYASAVTIDVLLHAWLPSIPATAPAFTNGAFVLDAATQWSILLIYAIILVVHATLNIFGVRIVAFLNDISVGWHIVFVALIALAVIIATAASLQFNPGTAGVCCAAQVASSHVVGFNGPGRVFLIDNNFNTTGFPIWYAFLLTLLLAQYTYTGYDASAHMTEETVGAETRAPWGVVMSV